MRCILSGLSPSECRSLFEQFVYLTSNYVLIATYRIIYSYTALLCERRLEGNVDVLTSGFSI